MPDIEQRLREVHPNSQQYAGGSMILLEAADRIAELEQCLKEARANMEDWGGYVPEYFQQKHGLAEDLAAIDRALSGGGE